MKNGCYTLVAIEKVGFHLRVHRLALLGHTGRSGPPCRCLPGIRDSKALSHSNWSQWRFHSFLCCKHPPPPSLWALEHSNLFGGFSWWALMNILIAETACSITRPHTVGLRATDGSGHRMPSTHPSRMWLVGARSATPPLHFLTFLHHTPKK